MNDDGTSDTDSVVLAPAALEAADDPDDLVAGINALVDQVNSEDYPVVAGIRRSVDGPQFDRAPLSYLERDVYDLTATSPPA